jgi:hypothetical protein
VTQPAVEKPATDEKTAVPAPAPAPAPAAVQTSNYNGSLGVPELLEAMRTLGMSTGGLQISYSESTVGYPGGSYVNRLIHVSSGGKKESFSGELTQKNPLVTAYELQRYFGVAANPGGASGTVRQG